MIKTKNLEKYLFDFFSARYEEFDMFYRSVHQNRHFDVYPLENGTSIMDFMHSLHSNIQETFLFQKFNSSKVSNT